MVVFMDLDDWNYLTSYREPCSVSMGCNPTYSILSGRMIDLFMKIPGNGVFPTGCALFRPPYPAFEVAHNKPE